MCGADPSDGPLAGCASPTSGHRRPSSSPFGPPHGPRAGAPAEVRSGSDDGAAAADPAAATPVHRCAGCRHHRGGLPPDPRPLTTGDAAAFVIDAASGETVTACAVATLDRRLPGPGFATGLSGSMSSVFVEPDHRGRGLARAVVTAAVQWLDGAGAEITDIHATPAAEHPYRSLGFARARSTPLRRPRP
ncbi:GNAT family N-acetyltransferase [Nakamurella flavida]|nr:GNAT family N-acetyltransferase [Nakamurella flavida]